MDSVLILLYGFSSYHWRWCIWPPPCGHVVRHSVEVSIPCDRQLTNSYHFDVAPLPNKMIPQRFNEKMQRPKQRRLEVSRLAWPAWGKITKIYLVSVTCKNVSMIRISFLSTQLSLEMSRNAWQKTYANYLNSIKLQDNVYNNTSIAKNISTKDDLTLSRSPFLEASIMPKQRTKNTTEHYHSSDLKDKPSSL